MTSGGDERTLTVAAGGMCIDCQLPLSMGDGAVHQPSELLIAVIPPKPTEEMTS
jgi:hypothetical protein